jgi:hypothetical protein
MTEEVKPVCQAAYTVIINLDGTIQTELIPASDTVQRKATTYDIYQTSKELISDIESHLLADRVAERVISVLQPRDEAADFKAKLIDALTERGIDTPKA